LKEYDGHSEHWSRNPNLIGEMGNELGNIVSVIQKMENTRRSTYDVIGRQTRHKPDKRDFKGVRNGPKVPSAPPHEWEKLRRLRSQNATLKRGQHRKYSPYAFTEHGALMAANILELQMQTEGFISEVTEI